MCGVDCVGIGADYNGVSQLPEGLEDVSAYPNLFAALVEDGTWDEDDLRKAANGNILRVLRRAEAVRDALSAERAAEERMEEAEWQPGEVGCMSEVEPWETAGGGGGGRAQGCQASKG